MRFNFLLQTTRVLHHGNFNYQELDMVYNFLTSIDNEILNDYNYTCTIPSYDNDIQLYVEVLDKTLEIFEGMEEYEKCQNLKNKREEALIILNKKTI
jgi:hypothetical protein